MKKITQCLILFFSTFIIGFVGSAQTMTQGDPERGEYLSILGDCQACHTYKVGDGKPFAGGYPISSPLGDIYSSNITPSKTAGIGNYSLEDFTNVLRKGIRADGEHLYPAMPYTAYTKLSDEDIADLYAYFMLRVKPVDEPLAHQTDLPFPFDMRSAMIVWNALFLKEQRYQEDSTKSAEWNRGAYIVEALAHCSTCHTPRNFMMGEVEDQYLAGGALGSWYAPNITSSPISGIGSWSLAEIVQYLQTGYLDGKAQAAGPMAEAVEDSFQYTHPDDLRAIATYLLDVPAIENPKQQQPRDSFGKPYDVDIELRGLAPVNANHTLTDGASLYSAYCASCHQSDGRGTPEQFYPSLFNNTATGDYNPSNAIAAVLLGVERQVGKTEFYMPNFGENSPTQPLSDIEIAKIVQFVYQKYGNSQVTITADMVKEVRLGGPVPLLIKLQPYMIPAIVVTLLLLLWLIRLIFKRRNRSGYIDRS